VINPQNIKIGFDERKGHTWYQTTTDSLKKEMIRRGYSVEVFSAFDKFNVKEFDVIVTNYMAKGKEDYKAPIVVYLPHGIGLWKSGTQTDIPTDFFIPGPIMGKWFQLEQPNKKYHIVGFPRIDSLLNKLKQREQIRNVFIQKLKLNPSKPIVAYVPTFNNNDGFNKRGTSTELNKIDPKSIPNFIISIHGLDLTRGYIRDLEKRFQYVYWEANKENLLVSADVVVGDISSLLIESLVLNVPIIHLYRGDYAIFEMFDRAGEFGLLTLGEVCKAEQLAATITQNLKVDKFAALRAYWLPNLLVCPQEGALMRAANTLESLIKEKFDVK